jgi:hypothetical protein
LLLSKCFQKRWESHISAQSIYLLSSVQIGDTLPNNKQASKSSEQRRSDSKAADEHQEFPSFV